MLSKEIEKLRDQLAAASGEGRLNPVAMELAYSTLTDIARRVTKLERLEVPPPARVSETDLRDGKVLVLER